MTCPSKSGSTYDFNYQIQLHVYHAVEAYENLVILASTAWYVHVVEFYDSQVQASAYPMMNKALPSRALICNPIYPEFKKLSIFELKFSLKCLDYDPDGEIEISGKNIFEIQIPKFCYIQVIVEWKTVLIFFRIF